LAWDSQLEPASAGLAKRSRRFEPHGSAFTDRQATNPVPRFFDDDYGSPDPPRHAHVGEESHEGLVEALDLFLCQPGGVLSQVDELRAHLRHAKDPDALAEMRSNTEAPGFFW
jgi:hypothetical protein